MLPLKGERLMARRMLVGKALTGGRILTRPEAGASSFCGARAGAMASTNPPPPSESRRGRAARIIEMLELTWRHGMNHHVGCLAEQIIN
jgi:hypothetical protein